MSHADTACGWGQFPAENFESSKVECFDLHRHSRPNCGAGCSTEPWDDHGQYSTNLFGAEAVNIISAHNVTMPLFFYLPWQGVHAPAQAPEHYVRPYEQRIADPVRCVYIPGIEARWKKATLKPPRLTLVWLADACSLGCCRRSMRVWGT